MIDDSILADLKELHAERKRKADAAAGKEARHQALLNDHAALQAALWKHFHEANPGLRDRPPIRVIFEGADEW